MKEVWPLRRRIVRLPLPNSSSAKEDCHSTFPDSLANSTVCRASSALSRIRA